MSNLPKNWDRMPLGALWDNLNDPRRYATPQSTIDAILYCVRTRGLAALKEAQRGAAVALRRSRHEAD